jgi:Mrp family chromosome partitioning ATPase
VNSGLGKDMEDEESSSFPVVRPSRDLSKRHLLGAETDLPQSVRTEILGVLDTYIRKNPVKRLVDLIARRQGEFNFRSIAVISQEGGEGRTFFTAVLARSLVEFLRARVLVVDATGSARVPPLLAGLDYGDRDRGAEVGSLGWCEVATIGNAEAHDRFRNEFHFGEMVKQREPEFDLIIADTQALGGGGGGVSGCDAALIAQQVDTYILVVSDSSVDATSQKIYSEQLSAISTPCLGVVHNPMK